MDIGSLHIYYSTMLSKSGNDLVSPVGRSEFGDLIGMLEGCGLAGVRVHPSSPRKRAFKRSTSFENGTGCKSGEVRLGGGIREDEVRRGLGISEAGDGDVMVEEVRRIWEKEGRRLRRELRNRLDSKSVQRGEFEDAMEDEVFM
jgi:cell division control protein 6